MMTLPPGLDLEQIRRAADVARQAQEAIVRTAGWIREEMIDATQRAAEDLRFVPPEMPALHIVPPEVPSVAMYIQSIGAQIQSAFRDGFVKLALEWRETWERLPGRVRDALQVLGDHGWLTGLPDPD